MTDVLRTVQYINLTGHFVAFSLCCLIDHLVDLVCAGQVLLIESKEGEGGIVYVTLPYLGPLLQSPTVYV